MYFCETTSYKKGLVWGKKRKEKRGRLMKRKVQNIKKRED